MEIAGQKLNQIEEILYKREAKKLNEALRKIGEQLEDLFRPYYDSRCRDKAGVDGDFSSDFSELIKEAAFASTGYYGGHYSMANLGIRIEHIPEKLKASILKKICADFIENIDNIEDVCSQIQ